MTATHAMQSQGMVFSVGDGGSPEVFHAVAEVKTIGGPDGSASVIDVSTLDSTAKEKIMGLPDEGKISLDVNYYPGDTNGQAAIRTARANRTKKDFKITFTDSPATHATFSGYVTTFSIDAGVDAVVAGKITIEITGPVTFA